MHIVGNDVVIWDVDGDCIAELNEIRINVERTMIDVSGIQIGSVAYPMAYYRVGELQLNITASQMIENSVSLFNKCVQADEVYVTFAWQPGGDGAGNGSIINGLYCYIVTDNVSFPGRSEKAGEELSLRPSSIHTGPELAGLLLGAYGGDGAPSV